MKSTLSGLGKGLLELGHERGDVVLLHADRAGSEAVNPFASRFPDRTVNCLASEQDMVTTAAGLALGGRKPVAVAPSAFLTARSFDQIRTCLAIPDLEVVLVGTHSGLSAGEDGAVHQMNQDVALMRSLPRMSILVPSDFDSSSKMMKLALEHHGPVYIRLGRDEVPDTGSDGEAELRIGGGRLLVEGDGVTLCACGIMVHEALKAAKILSQQGINAEVIDCFSLKPLPSQLSLSSLRRTGCCVVAEEHNTIGGLSEAIAALSAAENPVPVRSVAITDRYGQSGTPLELQEYYGLTFREIVGESAQVWSMRRR